MFDILLIVMVTCIGISGQELVWCGEKGGRDYGIKTAEVKCLLLACLLLQEAPPPLPATSPPPPQPAAPSSPAHLPSTPPLRPAPTSPRHGPDSRVGSQGAC